MTSLILHPDITALRERIALLRRDLSEYFDERLRLTFEIIPELRRQYTELFGELERKVQERTLELSERKRMVELFALKLDRGQKLDAAMVELVLRAVHNEFGRVRSRVERAVNVAERSRPGRGPANGVADADSPRQRAMQRRDLYRRLARLLHPDLSRHHDEFSRKYWPLVQDANMRGDIPLLRTLLHLVQTMGSDVATASEVLASEEQRLREAVRVERREVESLRDDEIYRLRDRIDDETWQKKRTSELEGELADVEREIAKCDLFLAPILSLRATNEPAAVQNILENFVETMYFNNR